MIHRSSRVARPLALREFVSIKFAGPENTTLGPSNVSQSNIEGELNEFR